MPVRRKTTNTLPWWWWVLGAAFALMIWGIFSGQWRSRSGEIDQLIKTQQQTIDALSRLNEKSDEIIEQQQKIIDQNRAGETRIINRYYAVPAQVRSLNKEQLRQEVLNYE